ncbi:MAG: agmatinase [Pseudomonadota bacterium]
MKDNAFTATDLHGKSDDRTFAGALSFARRKYSKDVSEADAVVWGIPLDVATSNRPGTRFGPRGIRAASAIMDNDPQYPFGEYIFDELGVVDYGDCHIDYARQGEVGQIIYEQTKAILAAPNAPYLLSLGGDHFVTGPLLKAHAEKHGPLALVQFDAHQDTWDDDGNFAVDHGTFITTAAREGWIDADRSIQIGIRTHAPRDCGIEIIDGLTVDEMSVEDVAKRIYERTGGTNVYMTFDIDCLDPAFAPGTGTPVSGGMSSAKALRILRACKNLQVVGSDVVEVSPPYDHAEITSIAGSTIAMYMLGNLWERRRG